MHPVQILHCLPCRTFAQIVEARHNDQTLARSVEREPDIAKIRMRHMLQFRQIPRRKNPNHRTPRIKLAVQRFNFVRFARWIAARRTASREFLDPPEANAS